MIIIIIMNSENVAAKLNEYFSSIADILNENSDGSPKFEKSHHSPDSKLPEDNSSILHLSHATKF